MMLYLFVGKCVQHTQNETLNLCQLPFPIDRVLTDTRAVSHVMNTQRTVQMVIS